jgi:hypothetical protein
MPNSRVDIAIGVLEDAFKKGNEALFTEKNSERLKELAKLVDAVRLAARNATVRDKNAVTRISVRFTVAEPNIEADKKRDASSTNNDKNTKVLTAPDLQNISHKKRSPEDAKIRSITKVQKFNLFHALEARFERAPKHYKRPKGIKFNEVKMALEKDPAFIYSLFMMEKTGGAPDIIAVDDDTYTFADCSAESPAGRRNCVYDKEAEKYATRHQKKGNAVGMAEDFGVENMMEDIYRDTLQKIGEFDSKTSSWIRSFDDKDNVSSAPIGSRRDGKVRVVQQFSHYSGDSVGWRGILRVPKK